MTAALWRQNGFWCADAGVKTNALDSFVLFMGPNIAQIYTRYLISIKNIPRTAASSFDTDDGSSLNLTIRGKKPKRKNISKDVLTGALSQDRKIPTFREMGAGEAVAARNGFRISRDIFFFFFNFFLSSVLNDRVAAWYSRRNDRIAPKYTIIKKCTTLRVDTRNYQRCV